MFILGILLLLAIIMLAYAIPFIGPVAKFAGVLFGFGGLVMVVKDFIWKAANNKK
jgi:hypothetical protein